MKTPDSTFLILASSTKQVKKKRVVYAVLFSLPRKSSLNVSDVAILNFRARDTTQWKRRNFYKRVARRNMWRIFPRTGGKNGEQKDGD